MTPDIVVDIGNSRMKWGRVADGKIADMVSLSLDDEAEWDRQRTKWFGGHSVRWVSASVNPAVSAKMNDWASQSDDLHLTLTNQEILPLDVDEPNGVGIDRKLNALAARKPCQATVVVSIGTAVTIDLIDAKGVFRGGAILPGLRLMADSLATQTAKLPTVTFLESASPLPGRNTVEAIRTGIFWSILSAINGLRAAYAYDTHVQDPSNVPLPIVLTGGDAGLFLNNMEEPYRHVPELTLEGIRLVAESIPDRFFHSASGGRQSPVS